MGEAEKRPCNEAIASMYMYLDREMQEVALADIQAHIDDCPPCLEAFEFEASLKSIIASKCREQVPEHLYERIHVTLKSVQESGELPDKGGIPPT